MNSSVVGIDVSKDTLDAVWKQGKQQQYRKFANNANGFEKMIEWFEQLDQKNVHVCLEATGKYSLPVTKYLFQSAIKVSMVNPARIKAYRDSGLMRNKTDRQDAYVIADFCDRQKPALWTPPSPEIEELQALTRHLDDLQGILQQERNRMGSLVESKYVLESLQEHMDYLTKKIKTLKKAISEHIKQHPELHHQSDLLTSIPGVGALTAARLLAEIQDVHRFDKATQLAAYAGVTPKQFLSGTSVHKKGRMSKMGNANLRKALAYAVDRQAICDALSAGQLPATGFVPAGFIDNEGKDFSAESGAYGFEAGAGTQDEAVALFALAAAEMGKTVAELQAYLLGKVILYNTSEGHKMVAEMVQENWKTVLGVDLTLQNQEWAVFQNTRREGAFDVARGGWLTDFMDPAGMLAIFTTGNAYNDPKYENAAYDTLLSDSQATTDMAVHFAKLYEAQDMLMDDMPIVPIYYYSDIMMAKVYFVNWGRSVLGSVDFTHAKLER